LSVLELELLEPVSGSALRPASGSASESRDAESVLRLRLELALELEAALSALESG
jgi:hypothetical protein